MSGQDGISPPPESVDAALTLRQRGTQAMDNHRGVGKDKPGVDDRHGNPPPCSAIDSYVADESTYVSSTVVASRKKTPESTLPSS